MLKTTVFSIHLFYLVALVAKPILATNETTTVYPWLSTVSPDEANAAVKKMLARMKDIAIHGHVVEFSGLVFDPRFEMNVCGTLYDSTNSPKLFEKNVEVFIHGVTGEELYDVEVTAITTRPHYIIDFTLEISPFLLKGEREGERGCEFLKIDFTMEGHGHVWPPALIKGNVKERSCPQKYCIYHCILYNSCDNTV